MALSRVSDRAQAQLKIFVDQLPIQAIAGELQTALTQHKWVFVDLPTGSGKTLFLASMALLDNNHGETWVTEPTTTSTLAIHGTLADKLGQLPSMPSWVGFGAGGVADYTPRTRVKIMTTGHAINWLIRMVAGKTRALPTRIVLDEMHHTTSENWVAFALLRHLVFVCHVPIQVVVASATFNGDLFTRGPVASAPVLAFPDSISRPYSITEMFYRDDAADPAYPEALKICVSLAQAALMAYPTSSGMVFVAGEDCVQEVCARLMKQFDQSQVDVLGVYAAMPSHVLDAMLAPCPKGQRRVYVCTNVAETGLTLPDADWVVDSGYCKSLQVSTTVGAERLVLRRITQANAQQRAGRVGRCRPGYVFRAYGRQVPLATHTPYEFEIVPPYGYMLKLLHAGQTDLATLLDMPPERCAELLAALKRMNLVDIDGSQVTDLGYRVTSVPVAVPYAAMLLRGVERFNKATLLALCVFTAVLETGNTSRLFWIPPDAKGPDAFCQHFEAHYASWVRLDDLEAFVTLFFAMPRGKLTAAWCRSNFFNDQVARTVHATTQSLIYHAFYCARGEEKGIFDQHARAENVDFDALRRFLVAEFPERCLDHPARTPQGHLTYKDACGQPWGIDVKRRLSNFWQDAKQALPARVCGLTLFECESRRGAPVRLVSCLVMDPDAMETKELNKDCHVETEELSDNEDWLKADVKL